MSVYDDPFDDIVAGLEIPEPNVLDVTSLGLVELLEKKMEITNQLAEMGQLLRPTTQEARDLHSLKNAIEVEFERKTHNG